MKKIYKLLFVVIISFLFIVNASADISTCSDENLKKVYEEKGITNENDKLALKENCKYQNGDKTDKDYGGCTKNNSSAQSAYEKAGKIGGLTNSISWSQLNPDLKAITGMQTVFFEVDENLPKTKDYYVVGVKNNEVQGVYFAGCYKGYLQKTYLKNGKENTGTYKIVKGPDYSVSNKAVYYVKVLKPNSNGQCNTSAVGGGDIFLPAGIKLEYNAQDEKYNIYTDTLETRGVESSEEGSGGNSGYGFQKYDFDGCPAYFNLGISFPTWWTASRKNAFIFSNSPDIEYNISWVRKTFGSSDSAATQGTTAVDTAEKERITKCYDNIKPSNYSCEELKNFSEKIYSEQKTCNNENSNFFRDVDENVQTEMLQKVVTSLNNVSPQIVKCQLANCNVEKQSLSNNIASSKYLSCLKSCVSDLKISNTEDEKTYTNNCASCYKTFYNDLLTNNSITSEQKTCLDSQVNEYDKQLNNLQSNFAGIVNNNMEQALENKAHAAASTSYTKFTPPEMSGGVFGKGGSCSQILGSNGVKILKGVITTIRILAPIVALINAMIILLPAVTSKDADALKKASSKCVKLAVVLAIVEIFPSVIKLIGALFGWDTCGI